MSKLILMVGAPGVGKSTYVSKYKADDDVYVSRDQIRFSMVKENEEYFSKEKKVFKEYINQIQKGIDENKTVWADATHLNWASRAKVLDNLKSDPDEVEIYYFDFPVETSLQRNENRKGTRSYVPRDVILKMHAGMTNPETDPTFIYDIIHVIRPEGVN